MTKINKQQATNALERIKAALRANKEDEAIKLIQNIFAAGVQHGIDYVFTGDENSQL